jgi:DNA-binding response OmpR family regulator
MVAHTRAGFAGQEQVEESRMGYDVLVIEDHGPTAQLVRAALEAEGIAVRLESNGAAGLLAVASRRPDLIVLDVMMPVMNGFQTLDVLQSSVQNRAIPIIMLTAKSGDLDVARGVLGGALSYLTKPFAIEQLVSVVKRVLEAPTEADEAEVGVS